MFATCADDVDQGYEISREEKEISRDDFIERFQDESGEVELVLDEVMRELSLTSDNAVDAR